MKLLKYCDTFCLSLNYHYQTYVFLIYIKYTVVRIKSQDEHTEQFLRPSITRKLKYTRTRLFSYFNIYGGKKLFRFDFLFLHIIPQPAISRLQKYPVPLSARWLADFKLSRRIFINKRKNKRRRDSHATKKRRQRELEKGERRDRMKSTSGTKRGNENQPDKEEERS